MCATRLGVDRALVDGVWADGDVGIADSTIVEVGVPADGGGRWAVPGFLDLQVNGFAGVDFATTDATGYLRADQAMAATGVVRYQPTFITLPWNDYAPALEIADQAQSRAEGMVGVHLEGPFIAPGRAGAHDPGNVVPPTPERVDELARHRVVTWMTLAPEVDGGLEAIALCRERASTVAIGHSAADAGIAAAAFEAGATFVTHLFNAQTGLHHRAPGIPGAALDNRRVTVTVIVDGHHLAPEIVRLVFAMKPGRVALITDAIAATGVGDGTVTLGDRTVTVTAGVARLADGTLAGSVLTMDRAVRNTVEIGLEPSVALAAAAPGKRLAPGEPADVVVLDDDLGVVRTVRAGTDIHHR